MRYLLLAIGLLACAAPAGAEDAIVQTSEKHPLEDGQWSYLVTRSTAPWACGESKRQLCVAQGVLIDNDSSSTLECSLRVEYKLPNGGLWAAFDTPALILPHEKTSVHRRFTFAEPQAEVEHLSCVGRPPYQRLPKNPGCDYQMHGSGLENFYPESALRRSLEGTVIVMFTLANTSGHAVDVHVAESSLIPELDAAAISFVQSQHINTNCPGSHYDLRVRFRLHDQLLAGVN